MAEDLAKWPCSGCWLPQKCGISERIVDSEVETPAGIKFSIYGSLNRELRRLLDVERSEEVIPPEGRASDRFAWRARQARNMLRTTQESSP